MRRRLLACAALGIAGLAMPGVANVLPALSGKLIELAGRILAGASPATLPVEKPNRFVLTVNARTARALGLELPRSVLLRADRVIE